MCYYSASLSESVCLECADNTDGDSCDRCEDGYYRNSEVAMSDPNTCISESHSYTCIYYMVDGFQCCPEYTLYNYHVMILDMHTLLTDVMGQVIARVMSSIFHVAHYS